MKNYAKLKFMLDKVEIMGVTMSTNEQVVPRSIMGPWLEEKDVRVECS